MVLRMMLCIWFLGNILWWNLPRLQARSGRGCVSNLPRAQSETKRIKTTVDATLAERDEAATEQKGQTHESKRDEDGAVCVPDFTPAFQSIAVQSMSDDLKCAFSVKCHS